MSVTVDANVLLYAVNEDAAEHEAARELIERLGAGPGIVYLFWPTIMGFLRIATHPAILPNPLSGIAAVEAIGPLIARPHVRCAAEPDTFWQTFLLIAGRTARGNDMPDIHLAALMREHEVGVIYTRDRGFRRFEGIEVRDPLAA